MSKSECLKNDKTRMTNLMSQKAAFGTCDGPDSDFGLRHYFVIRIYSFVIFFTSSFCFPGDTRISVSSSTTGGGGSFSICSIITPMR